MKNIYVYTALLSLLIYACGSEKHPQLHVLKAKKTIVLMPEPATAVSADTSYLEYVFAPYNLVNIQSLEPGIETDLRYAGTNNFLKMNLYDGLRNAYLNCDAAIKLCNAQYFLKQINKNYTLLVFDAARPLHVQQLMWDSTRLDSATKLMYLAAPNQTSLHNYGCAVDVSVMDLNTGKELDMGTAYDEFDTHSKPSYEWIYLRDSSLSRQAYENRQLLRRVMKRAGYNPITSEWWHFSICTKEEAASRYPLIK